MHRNCRRKRRCRRRTRSDGCELDASWTRQTGSDGCCNEAGVWTGIRYSTNEGGGSGKPDTVLALLKQHAGGSTAVAAALAAYTGGRAKDNSIRRKTKGLSGSLRIVCPTGSTANQSLVNSTMMCAIQVRCAIANRHGLDHCHTKLIPMRGQRRELSPAALKLVSV